MSQLMRNLFGSVKRVVSKQLDYLPAGSPLRRIAFNLFGKRAVMEEPLVVILGCTGTGKSDLGVLLAKFFDGEVISADSMQIYKGLDIATNKIPESEMSGIPHHMMSFLDPSTSDFNVHSYQQSVLPLLRRMWAERKLPIMVGGTTYYIESVLFEHSLIHTNTPHLRREDLVSLSNDELYEYLRKIDPPSAEQVHKNNRYRIMRAIQIFESTGRRKSEYLAAQRSAAESEFERTLRFPNSLVFFLDAENEVLSERLDQRVEKMIERGLRKELEDFFDTYSHCLTAYGVAQSIAVKEFFPYLRLDKEARKSERGDNLFKECCETLKLHTKQYAKKQRNWVTQRLINKTKYRKVPTLVKLDASQHLLLHVVPRALIALEDFLSTPEVDFYPGGLTDDTECSLILEREKRANQIHHCDICGIDVQGTTCWENHLSGRRHRHAVKVKARNESKTQN